MQARSAELSGQEGRYWQAFNEFQLRLGEHLDERDALAHRQGRGRGGAGRGGMARALPNRAHNLKCIHKKNHPRLLMCHILS